MRILLLFCFMFFTIQLSAQNKEKSNSKTFIQLQGGLLFDNSVDESFTGLNLLNIGLSKLKNNRIRNLQLELIGYEVTETTSVNNVIVEDNDSRRLSAELIYNYSFALSEDILNGFFYGPSLSFLINNSSITPKISSSFPTTNTCYCIGLGVNGGYNWSLSDNQFLSFSTRVTLLDIGFVSGEVENPILTEQQRQTSDFTADFLRSQFQLMVGLNFSI